MNFFEWFYERVLLLNLVDYEGLGINLPINLVILSLAIALCAASAVINLYQRTIYTIFKKLLRAEAYSEESARGLSDLGLDNHRAARRFLSRGIGPIKSAVCTIGKRQLTYEEYLAEEKRKKEEKKKARKVRAQGKKGITEAALNDIGEEIKAAAAETDSAEAKDTARINATTEEKDGTGVASQGQGYENGGLAPSEDDTASFRFYIPEEKLDYARRIVEKGAPGGSSVAIFSGIIIVAALAVAMLMPWILANISKMVSI